MKQTASIDPKHLQSIQVALQRNEADRIKAFNAKITGSTTSSWNFGKLMVVGHPGSGKTAVVHSLLGGTFVPIHTPTVGIDMLHVRISSRDGWKKDKSDNFSESFMAKIKYERHQQSVEKRKKSGAFPRLVYSTLYYTILSVCSVHSIRMCLRYGHGRWVHCHLPSTQRYFICIHSYVFGRACVLAVLCFSSMSS